MGLERLEGLTSTLRLAVMLPTETRAPLKRVPGATITKHNQARQVCSECGDPIGSQGVMARKCAWCAAPFKGERRLNRMWLEDCRARTFQGHPMRWAL